jgi:hypothetical protein
VGRGGQVPWSLLIALVLGVLFVLGVSLIF